MLALTLVTLGKWQSDSERRLFDRYVSRLPWPVTLRELRGYPKQPEPQRRQQETALLMRTAAADKASALVWLDAGGPPLTSEAFATQLSRWQEQGTRRLCFLIGGDVGLDPEGIPANHPRLSLGPMTWPHTLVRVMLMEQCYRASTIMRGHPYHRGPS